MNFSQQQINSLTRNELIKKITSHHNSSSYRLSENTLRKIHNRLYQIDPNATLRNNLPPPPPPPPVSDLADGFGSFSFASSASGFGVKRKTKKMRKSKKSRKNRKSKKSRKNRKSRRSRK